ncbi:MAG: HlyD family efflux transporter periplasmic adaptor subunit, partial [Proteobacteria bacterium]|nr:HlyD family efflux transporter periplasmic adaptor subunit [Pseudomonadota bacterium]
VAPFDGWVLAKAVEAGQHVSAGQYLGEIYAAGGLDIEVRVPVKDLKWLPPDANPEKMPAADIVFSNAGNTHTWKGRVARIMARMDEKTRTLPMVVEVNQNDTNTATASRVLLRPGMFVQVHIKGKAVRQAFVLPRYVVHDDDTVFIMQGDRLKIRPVVVLRRFKDTVFVSRGLESGELIIKTALPGAVDGMRVRTEGGGRKVEVRGQGSE